MWSLTITWAALLSYSLTVSSHLLNGMNLKLSVHNNYPYDSLVLQPDGNYTYTGSTAEMVLWLAAKLNFTFTVLPVFKEASRLNISDLELSLKRVTDKEADGTGLSFVIDPDRAKKMDYTYFLAVEPYTLIVPKPKPVNRLFAFIRPFQPMNHIYHRCGRRHLSLALVTLLFIGMMCWFSWVYKNKTIQRNPINPSTNGLQELTDNFSYYAIYVTNILTNHGMNIPYAQHSFRILAAGWLLATLVLVNSYSSIIVSSLTVPLKNPPVNSFEDLAVSKDVSLILRQDVILGKQILGATTGVFKIIGDLTRAHPERILKDNPSTLKKLEDGHHAYSFSIGFNRVYVTNQYKKNGNKCLFLLSDRLQISSGFFSLLFQKGLTNTQAMNYEVMQLWETGLNNYWVRKYTPYTEQCTVANEKKSQSVGRQTRIKLQDLTGAFFILAFGLGAAILSFLVEIMASHIQKRTRKLPIQRAITLSQKSTPYDLQKGLRKNFEAVQMLYLTDTKLQKPRHSADVNPL